MRSLPECDSAIANLLERIDKLEKAGGIAELIKKVEAIEKKLAPKKRKR